MRKVALIVGLVGLGCRGGEIELGAGPETDGRLTSDVYTWSCESEETQWMGALGFDVALEFVPDELASRELPAPGECQKDLSMFAIDTLTAGAEIPDLEGNPHWQTASEDGELEPQVDGLWYDEVFKNVLTCREVGDVVSGGVELVEAGVLDGVITPQAGEVTFVGADVDTTGGIDFGTTMNLSWTTSGWDESFVQIRRVKDGLAVETVTCGTTGLDTFAIDEAIWAYFDEAYSVDVNFMYVGFQNSGQSLAADGVKKVDVATRALHVVGITEI